MPIDRFELVSRHNPVLTEANTESPLSVGNGEFAFTADITGLDFSSTGNNMVLVAQVIEAGIRAAGAGGFAEANCTWTGSNFVISSGTLGPGSTISNLSAHGIGLGTDISGLTVSSYSAMLLGGAGADASISNWNATADGNFTISIDGDSQNVGPINFTAATTMSEVALAIQNALQAVGTGGFTGATHCGYFYGVNWDAYAVAAGDWNHDGWPDLIGGSHATSDGRHTCSHQCGSTYARRYFDNNANGNRGTSGWADRGRRAA